MNDPNPATPPMRNVDHADPLTRFQEYFTRRRLAEEAKNPGTVAEGVRHGGPVTVQVDGRQVTLCIGPHAPGERRYVTLTPTAAIKLAARLLKAVEAIERQEPGHPSTPGRAADAGKGTMTSTHTAPPRPKLTAEATAAGTSDGSSRSAASSVRARHFAP